MPFRDVEELADEIFHVDGDHLDPPCQVVVEDLRRDGRGEADRRRYERLRDAGRDRLDAR
jgi:hypothetical protein